MREERECLCLDDDCVICAPFLDCWSCGGDGVEDDYENDPVNESPGTWVPCHNCGGTGLRKDMICG